MRVEFGFLILVLIISTQPQAAFVFHRDIAIVDQRTAVLHRDRRIDDESDISRHRHRIGDDGYIIEIEIVADILRSQIGQVLRQIAARSGHFERRARSAGNAEPDFALRQIDIARRPRAVPGSAFEVDHRKAGFAAGDGNIIPSGKRRRKFDGLAVLFQGERAIGKCRRCFCGFRHHDIALRGPMVSGCNIDRLTRAHGKEGIAPSVAADIARDMEERNDPAAEVLDADIIQVLAADSIINFLRGIEGKGLMCVLCNRPRHTFLEGFELSFGRLGCPKVVCKPFFCDHFTKVAVFGDAAEDGFIGVVRTRNQRAEIMVPEVQGLSSGLHIPAPDVAVIFVEIIIRAVRAVLDAPDIVSCRSRRFGDAEANPQLCGGSGNIPGVLAEDDIFLYKAFDDPIADRLFIFPECGEGVVGKSKESALRLPMGNPNFSVACIFAVRSQAQNGSGSVLRLQVDHAVVVKLAVYLHRGALQAEIAVHHQRAARLNRDRAEVIPVVDDVPVDIRVHDESVCRHPSVIDIDNLAKMVFLPRGKGHSAQSAKGVFQLLIAAGFAAEPDLCAFIRKIDSRLEGPLVPGRHRDIEIGFSSKLQRRRITALDALGNRAVGSVAEAQRSAVFDHDALHADGSVDRQGHPLGNCDHRVPCIQMHVRRDGQISRNGECGNVVQAVPVCP